MKTKLAKANDKYRRKGLGIFLVEAEHLDRVKYNANTSHLFKKGERMKIQAQGHDIDIDKIAEKDTLLVGHHNAYVTTGLRNALNREFGLGGTAVGYIGVSSDTDAVDLTDVNLNGSSGGSAANTIIKAATPVLPSSPSATVTTTVDSPFVNADFTSGVFVWNKIGLLFTSTDAGTGLVDVIGGTGGTDPYDRTFSLDLTSAGQFSVIAAIAVTASAI